MSPGPAARAPTIVRQDEDDVRERIQSSVIDFVEIFLRIEKEKERRIPSEVIYLLTDTVFEKIFLSVISKF